MTRLIILTILMILCVVNSSAMATIDINDGDFHLIDNAAYQNDMVWLDHDVINDPGTHLNVASGGIIGRLFAFSNAKVTMSGGTVEGELHISGNATVNMNFGSVHDLQAYNYAAIAMTGGNVDILAAGGNSIVTVSGGSVNDFIVVGQNGMMFLEGNGFTVTDLDGNITSLSYGDKLSDFGMFVDHITQDYFSGTVTGTLKDSSVLDVDFFVYNTGINSGIADIIIIPEPGSLVLLGLGGLLLRKRKRGKSGDTILISGRKS